VRRPLAPALDAFVELGGVKAMLRKSSAILLMLTLFAGISFAGIRGPGKYAGIVIFDRWDTCYLYSGIYLMYVSGKTKEGLRKYEGKSIIIDAKEVFQPINPGDGLIGKYKFLGFAKSKGMNLKGLSLTVVPQFENEGTPKFLLEIANSGSKPAYVGTGALALTLLGTKQENMFSPSDGKSDAWLTREPFKIPAFAKEMGFGPKTNKSHPVMWKDDVEYYFDVKEELPDSIEIQPNQKTSITMSFHLPRGEYDFLCGYGGGVHEDKSLVSNIVAFDVDENGKATVDNVTRINQPASNNSFNPTPR
jgi:hypothetical protein